MDPTSLSQYLTHTVKVSQVTGVDDYAQEKTTFYKEVPCLVDTATGRRRVWDRQGEAKTFDYAITFDTTIVPCIGMILQDGRDHTGASIFVKAAIEEVRPYRHPKHGVTGYLTMARARE